jgi:hypothetical protein
LSRKIVVGMMCLDVYCCVTGRHHHHFFPQMIVNF